MAKTFTGETDEGQTQLVIFKLGHGEYGVGIMKVQEIIKMQKITRCRSKVKISPNKHELP